MISLAGSRFRVEYDFDNDEYKVFTRDHSGQKRSHGIFECRGQGRINR